MKSAILLLILFLPSCMSMQNLRQSWEGKPIENVTAAWGKPNSEISNEHGGITSVWISRTPGKYGYRKCKRTLTSDSTGLVIKETFSGCPYFYFTDKY